jgi:hypothetical protein
MRTRKALPFPARRGSRKSPGVPSLAYSVSTSDDALGRLWAAVATVFLFRESVAWPACRPSLVDKHT